MNNYRLYETTDFVLDKDFIQWVYERKNDDFWNNWMNQNPEKQLIIAEARRILQSLQPTAATIAENEVDEEVSKLLNTIRTTEQAPVHKINANRKWWWAAASFIFLAGIAILTITLLNRSSSIEKFSYNVVTATRQLIEHVNTSDKPLRISMPDGSTAELAPASRLSYANDFKDSANRDVFLSGEAFFNVTKNPKQPFRVFTDEVVTKVLGTSFSVSSFQKDKTIRVTVKTGKVNVYSQETFTNKTEVKRGNGESVLLTPNQQAVYVKEKKKFEKKLLEKPVIIVPGITDNEMMFEETPVVKILELLKKAYGISIVYDPELLRSCTLTADLTNESLYTKLDFICKAIDAGYEIVDSEIFFNARGCN